jgi:hypothetical protein
VLATLLPGVRELRAPLAAGYLWLLLAWIIMGDRFPTRAEAERAGGPLGRLYAVEPLVATAGLLVIASVAAYLIGSLTTQALVPRLQRIRWSEESATGYPYFADAVAYQLEEFMRRNGWQHNLGRVLKHIRSDRELIKLEVLVQNASLHSEIDRPDSPVVAVPSHRRERALMSEERVALTTGPARAARAAAGCADARARCAGGAGGRVE